MVNILSYSLLLFILSSAFLSCQQERPRTTVIQNVQGYTFYDNALRAFSALVFREGKVVDVYSDTTFDDSEAGVRVINGNGKVMLPGLIDAHGHVMGLGFQQMNVDLTGTGSLDAALQRVEEYSAAHPGVKWIRGRGWNHTHWNIDGFPTAEELDRIEDERPVWLLRIDGHAGWANTKAMKQAGISRDTPDPEEGKIIRDESGAPTGVFVDEAMDLIDNTIPDRQNRREHRLLKKLSSKCGAMV